MPTSKRTLILHFAHLMAGSFAASHGKPLALESANIDSSATTRELHKKDPTHILIITNLNNIENHIDLSRQTKASPAAERNLAHQRYPIYQIVIAMPDQSIKTHLLFLSKQFCLLKLQNRILMHY